MAIKDSLAEVNGRIGEASRRAGRDPSEIILVAVTKNVPVERIRQAVDAGVMILGENRVQEAASKVEKIGVDLSERKLREADLSLILVDQSRSLNKDDIGILAKAQKDKSIIIINKIDLPSRLNEDALRGVAEGRPIVRISALTGEGIDNLYHAISDKVMEMDMDSASPSLAPNLRHKEALMNASEYFKTARINAAEGYPMEIIAVDIKSGLEALAEITGETGNEALYDKIFSEFCLGK